MIIKFMDFIKESNERFSNEFKSMFKKIKNKSTRSILKKSERKLKTF